MQYNENHSIFRPAMDWMEGHYQNMCKIITDVVSLESIEGKTIIALGNGLKEPPISRILKRKITEVSTHD